MTENSEGRQASTATKSRRPMLILAAVVATSSALYGIYYAGWGRFSASTDDAYVDGNVVIVAPQVSGTVIGVNTDETDLVQSGQTLVQLEDADTRIALQSAEAGLAQAVRQVSQIYATVRQLQAVVKDQQIRLDQANADYERDEGLLQDQGISTESYQHAKQARDSAEAALAEAQHQLTAAEAQVANTTLETQPNVQLKAEDVRAAYLALQRTEVIAPVTGYIAKRNVQLGQPVAAGTALLAIVPLDQVWIDANFKETELANVRIGQPVRAESDLYGRHAVYTGHVVGLAPGTGTSFALLPAQNASGNWIKVVQRLPVRVALDPGPLKQFPLRIGLSMNVEVDTHDRSGQILAATAANPADATPVYVGRIDGANAIIADIIRRNASGPSDVAFVARVP